MTIPFIEVPRLQSPTLTKYDAVVTGKGTASNIFQRWWQGVIRSINGSTDAVVQNQQLLQQAADYLIASAEWQYDIGNYTLARVSYLQIVVAEIVAATGTTISPPPFPLPDYPGDPPVSPF